jgi:hypothetical protein
MLAFGGIVFPSGDWCSPVAWEQPKADILRAYPVLTATDLEAAWEYAAAHPQEIDHAIRENEEGEEGLVE